MEKLKARKVGTLVYVSNGHAKYYGFFRSIEHTPEGPRITIDAAIPAFNLRDDWSVLNKRYFILTSTTIWKCTELVTLDAKGKSTYLSRVLAVSNWNSDRNNVINSLRENQR